MQEVNDMLRDQLQTKEDEFKVPTKNGMMSGSKMDCPSGGFKTNSKGLPMGFMYLVQKVVFWKGNPRISGKSRLVKYYI